MGYQALIGTDGERPRNRTYRLTDDLIERVNGLAAAHKVGQSDLVRYLLEYGLDAVEAGHLALKTRPAALRLLERGNG
jgi:hypothetical protein